MPNTRLPNSIFFALVALGAAQVSFYAPRIPELLGSHFSRGGFVSPRGLAAGSWLFCFS
jgi:hypothetical protein